MSQREDAAPRPDGKPPLPPPRSALLGGLGFLGVAAVLVHLSSREPDPADYLLALGLVALFTPLKALMIQWFDGRRPYASAFAASLFSMVVGLAFQEDLPFAQLVLRSTVLTAALEWPVLFAFRTADSNWRLLVLTVYLSVVVHLLSGGFVLLSRYPGTGALLMAAGVLTLWAPLFLGRARRRGGRSE